MEFKTQHHKLNRLVDVNIEEPCKQKKKTKERKELWDSLLQVYEKEADKENVEDVSVADIEQWTISHPSDRPLAFPQINPTVVFNILPGTVAGSKTAQSMSTINKKPTAQARKIKKHATLIESSFGPSSSQSRKPTSFGGKRTKETINENSLGTSSSKSRKPTSQGRKRNKDTATKESSFGLSKSKKIIKVKPNVDNSKSNITKSLNKKQKPKSNDKLKSSQKKTIPVHNSSNFSIKRKRKYTKSSDMKVTTAKSYPFKTTEGLKVNSPQHSCNLTLSYYSNEEIPSTRADGRVFTCKLVFRVCECLESDEVF